MSESTYQRWHADVRQDNVYDEDGRIVTHLVETREDCRRIVDDHNTCLGIKDPETTVPELLAVCIDAVDAMLSTNPPDLGWVTRMQAVLAKTTKPELKEKGERDGNDRNNVCVEGIPRGNTTAD